MDKITPHLWFDREAVEAAEFYSSTFPKSGVTKVITLHDTPSGDGDVVSFELFGQPFMATSAGPLFQVHARRVVSRHVQDEDGSRPGVGQALAGWDGAHAARFLSIQRAVRVDVR